MSFRGGEFSTGTTGNFQPELTDIRERVLGHLQRVRGLAAAEVVPCVVRRDRTVPLCGAGAPLPRHAELGRRGQNP